MREIWIGLAFIVHWSNGLFLAGCQPGQYKCANNNECLDAKQRCDHVTDCPDGGDEIGCTYQCRSPHMDTCRDGHCVAVYFFCDGMNDCGDWSDEANCTQTSASKVGQTCPQNTFKCEGTSVCIPFNWVCDGMPDCSDGKDELHCGNSTSCNNGFKCGSKECILNQWVCDGTQDCADGSDEDQCGPDGYLNHSCLPEHGWFSCPSKGTKKCMPISRSCDSFNDCDDHSDEGGLCYSTVNNCNTTLCTNGCKQTPKGPVCQCPPGLRIGGTTCVDIDECDVNPPLCSQKCENTHGSFKCSCVPGYTINKKNNQSCIANGPEMMLFITTDRDIRSVSMPSKEYGLIQSGISLAHSVTSDYEDGFVFWTEKSRDKAGIFKSLLDGSAHQYVVSVGVEVVEDLALDWVGRHIYFTDSGRKHIVACDVHGTICSVVVSGQLDKPRAVAVYPEERKLYWSDWGSSPHIGSSGMDGSQRKDIITTDIAWPNGLAVDETIKRIFWSDAKLSRIESSRLDGSDRIVLPVSVSHPYAIDVFENLIYWCDPVAHEVQSCDKFTGKNTKVLMKESSITPTGIHVHHPSQQRHVANPCWNIICSHLCLLSPNPQGFQCACPHGMVLNKDNRTCDPILAQQSSVIIATYTDLYQLTHHQIGKDSVVHLPTRIMENIGALAFNHMGHSVVYSDLGRKIIYSLHLETFRETILFENAESVEGLDVDPYTENIYWTEVTQGTVLVGHVNHDDIRQRVVLARGLHSPKGIVLAPELGLMFIVEGRGNHVINVWNMDGTGRQELVQIYGTVSSLVYDRKHLYFSDSVRGTIERIGVDGQDRIILRSHQGKPVAMDVNADSVFWLTQYSPRINWLSKQEPKTTRGFIIDAGAEEFSEQYRMMAIVDHFDYSAEHVCLGHTGGCSDICVPTPKEARCLCPLGQELSADKHSCHSINCSSSEWFKCQSGCVPIKNRCDGVVDCPLGEDEVRCHNETAEVTCSPLQFQCHSGGCIAHAFVCDGDFDCYDRSDEPDTCAPHKCFSDEMACPNQRLCIPRLAICDRQADCADGSDEVNCNATLSATCSALQFHCQESTLCIPATWVCDKDQDCEHGEDEMESLCSSLPSGGCPPKYIRCPSRSECIPRMALCNGMSDCDHIPEQELCAKLNQTEKQEETPLECSSNQFTCYLGSEECIPISSKCNCKFDCSSGEDEEGCPNCQQGYYLCPGEQKYINSSWLCDGLFDCSSGADESPALCPSSTTLIPDDGSCSSEEFECTNGKCIPFNLTCDGIRHCDDGTDEGLGCSNSCTDNGHCPHLCVPGPKVPTCICEPGYNSTNNGRTCLDIDECLLENRCSQYCNNTKGGYKCTCAVGYQLEHDHHTCKVVGGRPMMIVSGFHTVDAVFSNGVESRRLLSSDTDIKDIAYHDKESTLYWVTTAGVNKSDSTGKSLVYKLSGLVPSGLALDHVTGNLYVSGKVNRGTGQDVSVIKVIAKSADVNIITTTSIITDIAIDVSRGVFFWSEHVKPNSGRIIRSLMDGSSTLWFHSISKIIYPVALALDTIQSRVYWADLHVLSISSCDYDGQRQKLIVSNTNGLPISLTFFESRVSWSNVDQAEIRSQMIDSPVAHVQAFHGKVGHILTVHSVLEKPLPNPCVSASCGNGMCLLKNSTGISCHCPQGVAVLTSSPFMCREVTSTTTPASGMGDEAGRNPDDVEIQSSPGVTVASILICLAVLTVLAVLGWIYYKRWRQTIGSPLKFRFRNALGMTGESTGWEESVDYSDRKMLYMKSDDHDDDEPGGPQVIVDQNDNRMSGPCQTDSAYASQQSLAKQQQQQQLMRAGSFSAEEHQPQQLLPATYSMKDQLLASEL